MARLAATIAAAVVGMTIGVGIVTTFGDADVVEPVTVPVSLETRAPSEATRSRAPSEAASAAQRSTPVRVRIPAIGVDARLVSLGLNDDQSMEVPNFGLAGWYEPGPLPGTPGPAVIAAHVDSVDGPDVFFGLKDLAAGDTVVVELADGSETGFVVTRSEQQRKDDLPVERIWNDTDDVELRLITCGGAFDPEERSYTSNVIVFAVSA